MGKWRYDNEDPTAVLLHDRWWSVDETTWFEDDDVVAFDSSCYRVVVRHDAVLAVRFGGIPGYVEIKAILEG